MHRLYRKGTFDTVLHGDIHCTSVKAKTFTYEVEIAMTRAGLDSRGFMVDHDDIVRLFDTRYAAGTYLSCERLAEDAASAIANLIGSALIHTEYVLVRIWGTEERAFNEFTLPVTRGSNPFNIGQLKVGTNCQLGASNC